MKVLELFAGYGSQRLALDRLGIKAEYDISEIDKYALLAYEQLHGDCNNLGDITKIDENSLSYYDLITYSSPCQDFSFAGKQKGGEKGSGTRSSLLWECERIINKCKPKYLLMENVKALVSKKFKPLFLSWLDNLEQMGYNSYWKVLNAKDYGVPQNRERVFVVSIRKDVDTKGYKFPSPAPLEKRLKDMLEPCVDEKYYLSAHKVEKLASHIKSNEIITAIISKQGCCLDKITDVACTLMARDYKGFGNQGMNGVIEPSTTNRFFKQAFETLYEKDCSGGDTIDAFNKRVNKTGVCPTLTTRPEGFKTAVVTAVEPLCAASRGGNHEPKIVEGYRIRKLTPRECWRLMGVKDEYFDKLHDISNSQLYKLAGNSIVVDVLEAIFRCLFDGMGVQDGI